MSKIHDFLLEHVHLPVDAWTAGSVAEGVRQIAKMQVDTPTRHSILTPEYQLTELRHDFNGQGFRHGAVLFAPSAAVAAAGALAGLAGCGDKVTNETNNYYPGGSGGSGGAQDTDDICKDVCENKTCSDWRYLFGGPGEFEYGYNLASNCLEACEAVLKPDDCCDERYLSIGCGEDIPIEDDPATIEQCLKDFYNFWPDMGKCIMEIRKEYCDLFEKVDKNCGNVEDWERWDACREKYVKPLYSLPTYGDGKLELCEENLLLEDFEEKWGDRTVSSDDPESCYLVKYTDSE